MTLTPLSRSKGQLVADVLNRQHAGTGATWRINAKFTVNLQGRRHIVSPRAQLVFRCHQWQTAKSAASGQRCLL